MASPEIEKHLEPLSEDAPCGPDLEYDAEFGEMERAAQGKGEQQFGNTVVDAEPPDWKQVRKHVTALLDRTKDMRVAAYMARASLHLEGLTGFEFALALLRGYLERFWDSVHPELDHEDDDDPTYRTNTLITLVDESTLLRELRETPLVASRAMGMFSLRDVEHARDPESRPAPPAKGEAGWSDDDAPKPAAPSGPTVAAIDAAFSDAEVDQLQATEEATRLSAEHIQWIEQFVTEQVGVANAVSLKPLADVLTEMNKVLVDQLERRGVPSQDDSETGGEAGVEEAGGASEAAHPTQGSASPTATFAVNGKITTREDAIKAMDRVCEYYERNEPSSPLPLLIRRAQRLASKSFLDILRDLAPDAVSRAEALGGGSLAEEIAQAQTETESDGSSSW